ncbi:hypothetical protein AKJ60_00485 [candidate division MSBL1 archaeon SCGC-AAA385M11]|nr:hypothetical protein AKJ60_00485 [candidate division MSBL1 archaeon SCGC-AAA385M11]
MVYGFPRNLGGPVVSVEDAGPGEPETHSRTPCELPAVLAREQRNKRTTVSLSEGNGAQGDGQQEVGASHSTEEAGELSPGDPVEGR